MATHPTTLRGGTNTPSTLVGVEVSCIADSRHSGGPDTVKARFVKLGGVETVRDLLTAAGYDPTKRRYKITIVAQFERATPYPLVSGVIADPPGIRFRFMPKDRNPDHYGFTARVVVDDAFDAPAAVVGVKLKLAAARLYGQDTTPETEPVRPPQADLDLAYAALKAIVGYSFSSANRADWAAAISKEVGVGEKEARWDAAARTLVADGRVVWVADAGYAFPVPPPPVDEIAPFKNSLSAVTPPVSASPVPPPIQPQPTTPPVQPKSDLATDLVGLVAAFGTFHGNYSAAAAKVEEAAWAVRDAAQTREKARAALEAAETAYTAQTSRLAAAKAEQAQTVRTVDPELLVAMAAQIEAIRRGG